MKFVVPFSASAIVCALVFGHTGVAAAANKLVAAVATNVIPSSNATGSLPTIVKATYRVYRGGLLVGSVDEKFERFVRPGEFTDRYKITSNTRAEGAVAIFVRDQINVVSEGTIGAAGLAPTRYSSTRKTDTDRNFTARFDWAKNEIVREHQTDGRTEQEIFELPAGTQDRLSSMYQFMVISPGAQSITTTMTQGKHAEHYRYVKKGEPMINTPAGDFATIQYVRDAKQGESKAQLWLAKSKNFVPVRIIFEDTKGTILEQVLTDLVIQ